MPHEQCSHSTPTRRDLLATAAFAGALAPALLIARPARAATPEAADGFSFEITRSEAEWRALLDADAYNVLREGGTEWPESSPLWNDYSAGDFHCRGCDLLLFTSDWRADIDMGWVFFHHSVPNAVLMAIDTAADYSGGREPARTLIEDHCRRCGSHLGHIVLAEGQVVHCINGTSLTQKARAA